MKKSIVLAGGGTGMIGDPSGYNDLRQIMIVKLKHNSYE